MPNAVAFNLQTPAGLSRGLAARLRTGGHGHGGGPDTHPPQPPPPVSFRWTIYVLCSSVRIAALLAEARKAVLVQRVTAVLKPPAHTRSSCRKGRNSTADHECPFVTSPSDPGATQAQQPMIASCSVRSTSRRRRAKPAWLSTSVRDAS